MNHYPHHIGDFNSATLHLTFVERALYRELLDLYYDTERPLNSDVKKLARRVRAVTDEQRAALDIVLEEFFTLCEDGWHNERCDAEIAAYHQKQEQQRKAGQASAKARGAKKGASANGGGSDEGGLTGVERAFNGRSTNQNQNQNHRKETSSPKDGGDATGVQPERFEDGWHNERCDAEIAAYHQKQEQQRKAGQASAKARGAKKGASANGGGSDEGGLTGVERAFNGRSTNQNQNQNHRKETSSPKDGGDATGVQPERLADDAVPSSEAAWSVVFGQDFGVEVDPTDLQSRKKFWPLAAGWVAAGLSVGQMRAAVAKARLETREGIAYLPAYVDRVLATMQQPAAAAESFVERAARERMSDLAPLAAAQAPVAKPAPVVDGYAFFAAQAAAPALIEVAQ